MQPLSQPRKSKEPLRRFYVYKLIVILVINMWLDHKVDNNNIILEDKMKNFAWTDGSAATQSWHLLIVLFWTLLKVRWKGPKIQIFKLDLRPAVLISIIKYI